MSMMHSKKNDASSCMGWKHDRVPGCGDGPCTELLEELMQEQEFDPVQHAVARLLPAILRTCVHSFPLSFSLGCCALV